MGKKRKVRDSFLQAGSATWHLLQEITGGYMNFFTELSYHQSYPLSFLDEEDRIGQKHLKQFYEKRRALKRLQEQNIIKVRKQGNRVYATLTKGGALQQFRDSIIHKKDRLPEGFVCLVSFDIPEDVAHIRTMFRNLLKAAGFKQVHKSVWESKRDVVEELRTLVKFMRAGKWISVYLAS